MNSSCDTVAVHNTNSGVLIEAEESWLGSNIT